ncbi:DUF6148 family protein [Cytobacillus firmus]|uniref:DUF6148 family protein n=1 Tax=Cytobacillus firmus TaxID=1399 RepID=UPI0018CEFD14|nr:DUF6148 family protein [Cytobacillus firmus]MBG9548396.1 hypothetical protein [Cytobacillus firmus]MBG9604512.1 hypothetical protein [Cytobacillus firmus]MED1942127.1 DUF6148 family protein [Cytobacillus firmus]
MITLERANLHLQSWLDAELAVSSGQSYSIGSRSLTRASLPEIRKQINYWRNEVTRLSGRGRKARRYVPRDL